MTACRAVPLNWLIHGVHSFLEFFTGFEMRGELIFNRDRFASLWVATNPCWAIVQRKAPKSSDLDSFASLKRSPHFLQHCLNRELDISMRQVRLFFNQRVDQLRARDSWFIHKYPQPIFVSASEYRDSTPSKQEKSPKIRL